MSSSATNEATITVPFKYEWNVDHQSLVKWANGINIDSRLFGPENLDAIKFKLQLSRNTKYSIELFSVSSMEPSLNLKYKIIMNTKNKSSEYKNDIKLSIGQQWTISDYIPVRSIQCEFELKIPDKLTTPLQELTSDLNSLRLKSRFADVTFVISKKEFPANKNIFSARSPVFEVMFSREEFVENQLNRVDITDIDEKVFEALLDFIYTAQVKQLDEIAPELLVAAHKYEIKSLVKLCAQSMMKSISIENAVNYLLHANMYNLAELKSKAIDFINKNAGKITKSEDWIKHVKSDNALLAELYLDFADKHPQA